MAFTKIKEYISTGLGSAGTQLIPKLILPPIIEEQTKALLPRELAAQVWTGFQGSSFNINLEVRNSNSISIVGEGGEFPMTNMRYSAVEFVPVKYGCSIRITREMMEDSQFEMFQSNLRAVGRRIAEKETELIITQLDGRTTSVTGGAQITIANIVEAMKGIEDYDLNPTDLIVGTEVISDLRNMDLFIEAQKAGNTQMMSTGMVGSILGLTIAKFSTNAAPSTTYAKYAYVIDRSRAFGIAIKRDVTVENYDLPSFDMSAAAVSMRIAVKMIDANAIARIETS
jgi:HK97 family phage major capsid protein